MGAGGGEAVLGQAERQRGRKAEVIMGNMGAGGYRYMRVGLGLGRRSWHGGSRGSGRGRGRGRGRGFRLNPKKFSVLIRVRVRLMYLFRLCEHALKSLITRGRSRSTTTTTTIKNGSRSRSRSRSRMSLVMDGGDCRFRSFGRTNSFYAEAIADCLDFIKRSSLSLDDDPDVTQPVSPTRILTSI